jgi:hypothetical protein
MNDVGKLHDARKKAAIADFHAACGDALSYTLRQARARLSGSRPPKAAQASGPATRQIECGLPHPAPRLPASGTLTHGCEEIGAVIAAFRHPSATPVEA